MDVRGRGDKKVSKNLSREKLNLEKVVLERSQELRKSEEWYRTIVDNSNYGSIVTDSQGTIVDLSERASSI